MNDRFLSCIIPVHNAAAFLEQCLISIIDQDLSKEDYEIICIDDGSKDRSREILDHYQTLYQNIRVVHQENRGVSAARNQGMKLAHGEYVWFIDADDMIAPNVLKELQTFIRGCDSDRIKLGSYSFDNELSPSEKNKLLNGNIKPNTPYKDVMATRTIYSRTYLEENQILFPENVHYGEDGIFNYQTMIHDPKTADSGILAYLYRRHSASVTQLSAQNKAVITLKGSEIVFGILFDDYDRRICLPETRRMLLYWMYSVLSDYSLLSEQYFCDNFIWTNRLDKIPILDVELRQLNRRFLYLSKSHNFQKLKKFAAEYRTKKENEQKRKRRKKLLSGYWHHPKRLLQKIIKG